MKLILLKMNLIKFLVIFVYLCQSLDAQKINTLTIQQPVEIAGDYAVAQAEWGDTSYQSFESIAAFANPAKGCDTFDESYSNKVLFIERGNCSFDLKTLHAQSSGAVAVVICNNNFDSAESLFLMAPDDTTSFIQIPVFLTKKQICDKLKIHLVNGGISAFFHFDCTKPVYSEEVVWGQLPGQGDFNNGLDGWTVDKGWTYNHEGIIRKGAYIGNPKIVGSATACNGVAEFNADHLDNNSIPGAFGNGDCPAPCSGSLTSPLITLTKPLKGLGIEFTQNLRQYQSKFYILVSKDSGHTFSDTIQINDNVPLNSNHITERKRVLFTGFEGLNEIMIRFKIEGNYYYWAIDDVAVLNVQEADLKIDRRNYAVAPTYKIPATQVTPQPIMLNLANYGNLPSTNVQLTIDIEGPGVQDQIILPIDDIKNNELKKNIFFNQLIEPFYQIGDYNVTYSLSGSNYENTQDAQVRFGWKVTPQTFGNLESEEDYGSNYMQFYASPWLSVPDDKNYSIGNIYYVRNGHGFIATKVRMGLENDMQEVFGQQIRVDLFEWTDEDNSNTSTPDERIRVGSNIFTLDDNIQNIRSFETDIWVSDNEGYPVIGDRVKLKNNTHYLITATVLPNNAFLNPQIKLLGYTGRTLEIFDRSMCNILATNRALDSLESNGVLPNRSAGSLFAWETNWVVDDVIDRHFRFIFNDAIYTKAYLEMDIEQEVGTKEPNLPPSALNVFPNPAARELFIDFYLDNEVSSALVLIYSLDGKLVHHFDYPNISNDRIKLDISGFSNGMYNLKLETSEGFAYRRIVINN